MDWGWIIAIPVALMLVLCPLMMIGMIVGGWIMGRRAISGGGRSGHGMMMCHGGHGTADHNADGRHEAPSPSLIEELKAERERLDRLIERAEKEHAR